MKKLTGFLKSNKVALVITNQLKCDPTITLGSNLRTSGGNAIEYYSSIRIFLAKANKIKDNRRQK